MFNFEVGMNELILVRHGEKLAALEQKPAVPVEVEVKEPEAVCVNQD